MELSDANISLKVTLFEVKKEGRIYGCKFPPFHQSFETSLFGTPLRILAARRPAR